MVLLLCNAVDGLHVSSRSFFHYLYSVFRAIEQFITARVKYYLVLAIKVVVHSCY